MSPIEAYRESRSLFTRITKITAAVVFFGTLSLGVMGVNENTNEEGTSKKTDCTIAAPGDTALGLAGNTDITINPAYLAPDTLQEIGHGPISYDGPAVNAPGLNYTSGLVDANGTPYIYASKVCK